MSLFVWGEVGVLLLNRMRCPLTTIAARYTDDRADNFDIFLPRWLARHNQRIFGTLFAGSQTAAAARAARRLNARLKRKRPPLNRSGRRLSAAARDAARCQNGMSSSMSLARPPPAAGAGARRGAPPEGPLEPKSPPAESSSP